MEYCPQLAGYSEYWAENREWRQARDQLKALCDQANIVAFACRNDDGNSSEWGTIMERNLTSVHAKGCSETVARMSPRYWQWATSYPGARSLRPDLFETTDPSTGWGVGYPKAPTHRQWDSRTEQWYEMPGPWLPLPSMSGCAGGCDSCMAGVSEDIQALTAQHRWEANTLREALNDWMFQHGVNSNVMDINELTDYVNYVNETERGNPIMPAMVAAAAPQTPDIEGTFGPRPGPGPAAPFFSLENFDLEKSWPGIAAGVAAALLL